MTLGWKTLSARGALAIAFGLLVVAAPVTTALTFALIWGVWALVDGVGLLAQAFQGGQPTRTRLVMSAMGVLGVLAGLFAITSPAVTAVTLTWVLGLWFLARGVFELVGAIGATEVASRGLLVATAVLDVLVGILFTSHPGRAAIGIAVVLGISVMAWGAALVAVGLVVRRRPQQPPVSPAAA